MNELKTTPNISDQIKNALDLNFEESPDFASKSINLSLQEILALSESRLPFINKDTDSELRRLKYKVMEEFKL